MWWATFSEELVHDPAKYRPYVKREGKEQGGFRRRQCCGKVWSYLFMDAEKVPGERYWI